MYGQDDANVVRMRKPGRHSDCGGDEGCGRVRVRLLEFGVWMIHGLEAAATVGEIV